jgi:4,5-dihydroxyphthalate decarboxylase
MRSLTRRGVLIGTAAAAAGPLLLGASNVFGEARPRPLPITVSAYRTDRTAALADGPAGIDGCTVTFEEDAIGDMNTHVFDTPRTRTVTEIGLHPFMLAYANEGFRAYTLLPIFLLRQFRHKSIFVRTDRGIERPVDLRGRRIGTPGYSSTSLTWIRGILEDEYGVKPTEIEWIVSAADSSVHASGKASSQEKLVPKDIRIATGPDGLDDSDLLEQGVVDALFHAAEPRCFTEGNPNVGRLFPDHRKVEQDYFKRTGIFPIMHAVAIRCDVAAAHPWFPKAVFDGFVEAKARAYRQMSRLGWAMNMLPWFGQELEDTKALMGKNFYSYGVDPNRKALETLCRYSHAQGLASRKLTLEELFEPSSLDLQG